VREGKPASGYTPLLQLEFEGPQDWLHSTYLLLDFKGLDSGEEVRLRITFGDSGRAVYSFKDLSSQWETVNIPLYDPVATEGIVRWDQVSSLTVGMGGTDVEEGVGLGTITVMGDSLSLESLGTALGMKTFLLSSQHPTPAPVAELLSAPGETPGEILEWEQASPWLYRLRIAATAPYTLVFSSTYDPLWRVFVQLLLRERLCYRQGRGVRAHSGVRGPEIPAVGLRTIRPGVCCYLCCYGSLRCEGMEEGPASGSPTGHAGSDGSGGR